jgi:predicted small integral membrane protein
MQEPAGMIVRLSKCALLLGIALFYTLVVFNNITDYGSNYQFVHHVLTMDTTFPGNRGLWRAIESTRIHTFFYFTIILWEAITGILCWWGAVRLMRELTAPAAIFDRAKSTAVAALTLGLLLWLTTFLTVGGEWFLMWQSATWNGQEAAFRMFVVLGVVLVYLSRPEAEPSVT